MTPPVRGDAAELGVAEVARVVAGAAHAGVGDDDRLASRSASTSSIALGEACARSTSMPRCSMRPHQLAADVGQPALGDAVRRAGEVVVEEMGEADHAKAGA